MIIADDSSRCTGIPEEKFIPKDLFFFSEYWLSSYEYFFNDNYTL